MTPEERRNTPRPGQTQQYQFTTYGVWFGHVLSDTQRREIEQRISQMLVEGYGAVSASTVLDRHVELPGAGALRA